MNILIVYYSKTGHTRHVAQDLARLLHADIDEIVDKTARSGIIGWIMAGHDAMKGNETQIATNKNPKDYDFVILGTPIWGWNLTPATRTYLSRFKNDFPEKIGYFQTSGGTALEKPLSYAETVIGRKFTLAEGWTDKELADTGLSNAKLQRFAEAVTRV